MFRDAIHQAEVLSGAGWIYELDVTKAFWSEDFE
jgi:hypothetical protein